MAHLQKLTDMNRNRAVVGIDMGATNTRLGIVDRRGRILAESRMPTLADDDPEQVLARLADAVGELRNEVAGVEAIGMGMPGPLDPARGVVLATPNMRGWEGTPAGPLLAAATGLPVYLDRDANVALLGEHWRGAARGYRDVILLTLGTGIGGSALVGGRLHHGHRGLAWEFGHMSMVPGGPLCGCGNSGCLEAMASGTALGKRTGTPAEDVFARAAAGDAEALAAVAEFGATLGRAAGSLINIFNPAAVILGGGMIAGRSLFWEPMLAAIKRHALAPALEGLAVKPAGLGEAAGVIGGARLALTALTRQGNKSS